jgi:DNA-binding LacI/PurR family transcriptional regulator
MTTTLREVAARLNLSPGLVSRVLNNDAHVRVSLETRERIHTAAREMQYRPSPSARALSTGRSRQVAISGADPGLHSYLGSRLLEQQGLIEAVAQQNYRVVVLPSSADHADWREFEEMLYTSGCDGFCLYAEQADPKLYAALHRQRVPFVVLGNPGDVSVPRVDHDNYRYAYDSVTWLHQQGHTRIGFTDFLPPSAHPFASTLRQGYEDAMRLVCGDLDTTLILENVPNEAERIALMTQPNPPTALIVRDWGGAHLWRKVLQTLGLRVPEDVAVLAHVAVTEAHYLEVGYAFHAHDPRLIGWHAGQILLRRIQEDMNMTDEEETYLVPPFAPQKRTEWYGVIMSSQKPLDY